MKSLRCLVMGLAIVGLTLMDSTEGSAQFPSPFKKKKTPTMPNGGQAAKPGTGKPGGTTPFGGNKGTDGQAGDASASAAGDVDIFSPTLCTADFLAKLKLNAEQKPEVAKIQTEFADKLKEAVTKAKEEAAKNGGKAPAGAPAKGGKGKGPEGRRGSETPGFTEAITLRSDYEEKVYNLLEDAQQKIWLDIKAKKGENLLTGGAGGAAKTAPKK